MLNDKVMISYNLVLNGGNMSDMSNEFSKHPSEEAIYLKKIKLVNFGCITNLEFELPYDEKTILYL